MASELKSTASAKPAKASASSQRSKKVRQYVNQQLEKTRRQVKTTDLIGGVLTIVAFSLAFLLLVAIWDAWIWPLSVVGRWICLGLLLSGCLVYAAVSILPLLLKKINPDYAAKMIEDAKPSFKNSLLNYVSLRRKNKSVNPAVFDAVSRQAATDLASVPSDATVDRSKLIRLGFILIGLLAFAVGYKMLSPKDPLQTFGRILSPSAKIAKPAVVKISDVLPGDTKVFFGDQLAVTAVVRGRHDPQDVIIEYSTTDGQLINQRIPMVPGEVTGRYRADLNVAGNGIRQSLTYRVVARDGSSPDFDVFVQPNPTIAVESLVLTPPAYTRLPVRTLEGQGSIDVIEGTEVVIHAVANLPIKMAYIELLDEIGDPNESGSEISSEKNYNVIRPIEMKAEGQSAVVRIVAQLNVSRKKPFATHYRIKFISENDDRNQKPNVYPIRIKPDLAPEVVILDPSERDVYVAENGTVAIDVEANDLDFEIASVALHIDHQGAKLLEKNLALKSSNGNQRVTARYLLKPDQLRLKMGDKAIFFATASDNRTSPQSGQPDPNISRTENFTLTVTEREKQQVDENWITDQDPNQQNNNRQNEQRQPDNGQAGADSEQNGSGSEGESAEDQNSENQQGAEGTNDSQSGGGQGNESGQKSGSEQESGDEGRQSGGSQSSGDRESGDENSQQNDTSQAGSGGEEQSSDQNQDSNSQSIGGNDSSNSGSSRSGEGAARSESNNQQNPDQDGSGSDSARDQTGQADDQGQRDEGLSDGQREPLNDDASEGEQFRRLEELLKQQENTKESDQDPNQSMQKNSAQQPGDRDQQPGSEGQQSSEEGQQQPGEGQQSSDEGQQQPGEGQQSSEEGQQQPGEGQQSSEEGQQQPGEGQQSNDEGQPSSVRQQSDSIVHGNQGDGDGNGDGGSVSKNDVPVIQKILLYDLSSPRKSTTKDAIDFLRKLQQSGLVAKENNE